MRKEVLDRDALWGTQTSTNGKDVLRETEVRVVREFRGAMVDGRMSNLLKTRRNS